MNRNLLMLLALTLMAGCMSSAPMAAKNWVVAFDRAQFDRAQWPGRHEAQWGGRHEAIEKAVRVSRVDVSAPYDGTRLVVMREDGTLAFDAYNVFAAQPSILLLSAAERQLAAMRQVPGGAQVGKLGKVIPSCSAAESELNLEIDVEVLGLDCRAAGEKTARVELTLTLIDGRKVISSSEGTGTAKLERDFSVAFSTAFAQAFDKALDALTVK